jgi:hypothetical protein
MTNTSRILIALCLALSPLSCATTVVGGGSSDNGSGGATAISSGPGGPGGSVGDPGPPGPPNAIAILASQINWNGGAGGEGTSGSTGGGTGVDPSTLYLEIGSPAPTCSNPFGGGDSCAQSFDVSIGIPPSLQVLGELSLSNPALDSTMSESAAPESDTPDQSCEGGGGSFIQGTLTIVSIDDTQVVFTLSGTMAPDFGNPSADGTYTALRCP